MKSIKGFTLIELLIVVAIIAILAAIAIPNFLQAQVRSKVARVRAETRTVATGLETYYVDENGYPGMNDGGGWCTSYTEPPFHARIPSGLTTPISYITSLPIDPFLTIPAGSFPSPWYNRYTFFNFDQYRMISGGGFDNQLRRAGNWMIYSWGPDRDSNQAAPNYGENGVYTNYDPTNGTVSLGNIIRTQRNTEKYDVNF